MTDGEVLRFPRAPDDAERGPLKSKRRRRFNPDGCKHPHPLVLDEEAHELRCGKCGQTLDIFDFLQDWISRWESYNSGYRAARQQERAARSRVETLKRVEKNAKARIRKQGVVLSVAQARVVRLQYVAIEAVGSLEETQRLARLSGVDAEKLREATRLLGEQVDLPDENRVAGVS